MHSEILNSEGKNHPSLKTIQTNLLFELKLYVFSDKNLIQLRILTKFKTDNIQEFEEKTKFLSNSSRDGELLLSFIKFENNGKIFILDEYAYRRWTKMVEIRGTILPKIGNQITEALKIMQSFLRSNIHLLMKCEHTTSAELFAV